MREFGNKFIAHAAASTSRATLTVNQQGVSIDKIESVLGRLTSVAARFSLILFGANHGGSLPVPQYDVLNKLDKPWLPENSLSELRQVWDEYHKIVEGWTGNPLSSLTKHDSDV